MPSCLVAFFHTIPHRRYSALTMTPTRPSFASLGLAPLILRLVLGATFLWAGLGKWMGTNEVSGNDAAILANLDIIPRPAPAAPPSATPPAAPLPTSGGAGSTPKPAPGTLFLLAQSSTGSPAAPTKSVPVTSGPSLATAADFPDPVKVRAMWGIALSIHRAAHPLADPTTGTTPRSLWPTLLASGLWPKVFAFAVLLAELGGGALMLVGFFTRLAALSGAAVMLGAIWLTQIGPAIQTGTPLLGFLPNHNPWDAQAWMPLGWQLSLLAGCLALACLGCGVLAVDRALAGYRAVPERFQRTQTSPPPGGSPLRGGPSSGAPRG